MSPLKKTRGISLRMSWDSAGITLHSLLRKSLPFVDAGAFQDVTVESGQNYDLSPLVERIKYAIKKSKAKRLVIDGLDNLFSRFQNKDAVRQTLYRIIAELKDLRVTVLMTAEKSGPEQALSRYGVEEFVADGVIELSLIKGQQQFLRRMFVIKLRGTCFAAAS